nr:SO_0444 family Cu/Zn efflux transporter [Desulfobulbaceae bacterium]
MKVFFTFIHETALASLELFLESSPYIILGLIVGGLLKEFISPDYVARHLGKGRFLSVVKAALFGIPLPLCSCGVLPAAAALKRQGANNGATTAFLIATPESGVDSITITYALLDPLMTIARPVAAFASALTAGFLENLINPPKLAEPFSTKRQGFTPIPMQKQGGQTIIAKIVIGTRSAFSELWAELAVWFFLGIALAGIITTAVPEEYITVYLGGGLGTMLLMLVFGIPMYICATASTPIAAALIVKGVSPGAALVFLLVGPATNTASLSVLVGLLGKRATGLYLSCIAVVSVLCGLALDAVYVYLGLSAKAVVGSAGEVVPFWLQALSALVLLGFSCRPLSAAFRRQYSRLLGGKGKGCSSTCSR